jgi:hypothetical protein
VPVDVADVTVSDVIWRHDIPPVPVDHEVEYTSTPLKEMLRVQVLPLAITYGLNHKLTTYGRVVSSPARVWDTLGGLLGLLFSRTLYKVWLDEI